MVLWKPIHLRPFLLFWAGIDWKMGRTRRTIPSQQYVWVFTTGFERLCEQALWKSRGGRGATEEQAFINFLENKRVEEPTSRGRGSLTTRAGKEIVAAFGLRSPGRWGCFGGVSGVMATAPLPNALPHTVRESVCVGDPEAAAALSSCTVSEVLQLIGWEEEFWLTLLQRPMAVKGLITGPGRKSRATVEFQPLDKDHRAAAGPDREERESLATLWYNPNAEFSFAGTWNRIRRVITVFPRNLFKCVPKRTTKVGRHLLVFRSL